MIETVVSAYPPGSGRSLDITWPDYLGVMPANGTAIPLNRVAWGRQGINTPSASIGNNQAQTNTGAGGTPGVFAATGAGFQGRGAVQLVPGTTAGATVGVRMSLDAMTILPNIGAAGANGDRSNTDDYACWRCFAIIAFPLNNSFGGSDLGIEWSAANVGNWQIIGGGAAGFGFQQSAAGTVNFVRRPTVGGALTSTVVRQTSAADLVKWNTYEIRVIGATPDRNAQLKVFVNGNSVLQLDWVNDNLGVPLWSTGQFGYMTSLQAYSGGVGAQGLVVQRVRFMAGPTEASLL